MSSSEPNGSAAENGSSGGATLIMIRGHDEALRWSQWLDLVLSSIGQTTNLPCATVHLSTAALGESTVAALQARLGEVVRLVVTEEGDRRDLSLDRIAELCRDGVDGGGGGDLFIVLEHGVVPVDPGWVETGRRLLEGCSNVVGVRSDDGDVRFLAARLEGPQAPGRPAGEGVPLSKRPFVELARSNSASLGQGLAGIYGDTVYVHDTGSRSAADMVEPSLQQAGRDRAAEIMLEHQHELVDWLRGVANLNRTYFVLGMHRSGTSCLTGCLEHCGAGLGEVVRRSIGQPLGNFEQVRVVRINDQLLARAGGTWDDPPAGPFEPTVEDLAEIRIVLDDLEKLSPGVVKDPRMLFTIDAWVSAARQPSLIGTFRHPEAVAHSLWDRDRIPAAQAHRLWNDYNQRLVALHREHDFPLIEFDLSNEEDYCGMVDSLAAELSLMPRPQTLRRFVNEYHARSRSHAAKPVPAECGDTWEYLREHRYVGGLEPGSFVSQLVGYGAAVDVAPPDRRLEQLGTQVWRMRRRTRSQIARVVTSLRLRPPKHTPADRR